MVNDLSGTQNNRGDVELSWTAAADGSGTADSYSIWRDSGSGFVPFVTTSNTFFLDTDTAVTADTTFSYFLRAVDAAGNTSEFGNTAFVPVKSKSKKKGKGGGGGGPDGEKPGNGHGRK